MRLSCGGNICGRWRVENRFVVRTLVLLILSPHRVYTKTRRLETASTQTKPASAGSRQRWLDLIYFFQSAEAEIVCVGAVSTAV